MPPTNPQLPPRGRISSSFDGISAGLGTAEVIGIVGAIILAVAMVALVCVIHSKKKNKEDGEKNARIDAWSGSDMPAGELRRDEGYERELRRERRVPGTPSGRGEEETAGLLPERGVRRGDEVEFLPGPKRMEGAVVRR